MSILTECLQRAEQQQGIATEAMATIHKIQAIAIGSSHNKDYEGALRNILNTINTSLDNIDSLLGIEHDDKPEQDATDYDNSVLANSATGDVA